ncbi:MAG: hypothetical protein L0Y58_19910 [Verrucomicrobia subdivision 3 bacterium]|nr:hypothetical protein [Limisphaerales bacterium]
MSDSQSEQKPDAFERALARWRVNNPLPPRFQEQVWRKIEGAQARRRIGLGQLLRDWLKTIMPRPAVAGSYFAVVLVAGLLVGTWQAQEHNARAEQTLARKYVQSVDPYQAPRL